MTATVDIGALHALAAQLRIESILTSSAAGITAPHIVAAAHRLLGTT